MKLYFIKISLRGVSPMVWRRLRVPGTTSLARLHDCIQIINGWDDDHLHQFRIYGKDYGIYYDGGFSYDDNAHTVYIDDFGFDVGDKFTYEYNFFRHIMHDIRIENIGNSLRKETIISCVSGSGMPDATKYDVMDVQLRMIEQIVERKGTLTIDDILEYQEEIRRVQFIKKHMNHKLAEQSNK